MFPYYLSLGMTYEQYWELSPFLVRYYSKAHMLKNEQENQQLWVQGLYMRLAILSSFDKSVKYPNEPFELNRKIKEKTDIDKTREIAVKQLESIRKQLANKFGEKTNG